MNYEKKYKEALERASKLKVQNPFDTVGQMVEHIFPELKESKDERIRKAIKKALQVRCDGSRIISDEPVTLEEAIAWLEKQKVTDDKVESKFKVGNWYQCTKDFFGKGVTFDKNTAYYCANEGCLQNEYGCHIAIVKELYDNFKLWTIEDAKDGDVLVILPQKGSESNEQIFLFKAINSRDYVDNCIEYYCRLCDGAFYKYKTGYMGTTLDTFYPATKEQRDLLFAKMKEAGYEWDGNKKELKKTEPKKLDANKVIAWLVANICDFEYYVKLFKKDFGLTEKGGEE